MEENEQFSGELVPAYLNFGQLVTRLREARGWSQREFAGKLDIKQQTISRWEVGHARPRRKDLAPVASLLQADEGELAAAAGYGNADKGRPAAGPAHDPQLPLQARTPDEFERFCAAFLKCLFREEGAEVHRYGATGHTQDGVDIVVRTKDKVYGVQCKRVQEFGAQKVHAAVAAKTFPSDGALLLVSNVATPAARDAMAKHAGWQMWDADDISAKFHKELSMVDKRDLVDLYFRGMRTALLGERELGPFQTPKQFFAGFTEDDRYFNHSWPLVGRSEELKQLTTSVNNPDQLVTVLVGAPGSGKSRILRELTLALARTKRQVYFVSPTEEIRSPHFEDLKPGPKLVVVDDAHERSDLGTLLRHATASENETKLLLATRPYGLAMVRNQATLFALDSSHVEKVELERPTKEQALELARRVLQQREGPLEAAEVIAELTYPTPLVTVLAAQILAREKLPPALLANSKDFQNHVLARFEKVIAGEIVTGQDVDKLQRVLRMVALLQPVVFDDPAFVKLLGEVEDLSPEDSARLLRLLHEGGIVFKRGLRYRLAPDLLADSIVQRNFVDIAGAATAKVLEVFERADTQYLSNLVVNLGRLEWRLRSGQTEGSVLLASLAPKLSWSSPYHNPHVEAVKNVAYYQPRLALDFAQRLIREKHGDDAGVCEMVRNAAYNMEFFEEACELLWLAGKDDPRALHQHPHHGVRLLKELAQFAPNKPVECVSKVVDIAIALLERPASLKCAHTPFEILEGPLNPEMEEVTSSGTSITITTYSLAYRDAARERNRVCDFILECLPQENTRKAFRAAQLLSEALRNPRRGRDNAAWNEAHAKLLARVHEVLSQASVNSVVLVKAALSCAWWAKYGGSAKPSKHAKAIIELLNRDLRTRFMRLVADAWGSETWPDDKNLEGKAFQADAERFVRDVSQEFPDPEARCEFVASCLEEMQAVAGRGYGTPNLIVERLLRASPEFSSALFAHYSGGEGVLSNFAGNALAVMLERGDRTELLRQLKSSTNPKALALLSEAYARQKTVLVSDSDRGLIQQIFSSKDGEVLHYAAYIARQLAKEDAALAIELICDVDFKVNFSATRDLFMWLSHRETFPPEAITSEHWKTLVGKLKDLKDLDDHWVRAFLRKATARVPAEVIDMLKTRIGRRSRMYEDVLLRSERDTKGLGLLQHADGHRLLADLLVWSVKSKAQANHADIGSFVAALCGEYTPELLELLVGFLNGGDQAHAEVVASVLRRAPQRFVLENVPFVRKVLNAGEVIGDEAVEVLQSALWGAAFTGSRSGAPGKPFKEDLDLQSCAKEVLASTSKFEPAHKLYADLLKFAEQAIEQQIRRKQHLLEEDE